MFGAIRKLECFQKLGRGANAAKKEAKKKNTSIQPSQDSLNGSRMPLGFLPCPYGSARFDSIRVELFCNRGDCDTGLFQVLDSRQDNFFRIGEAVRFAAFARPFVMRIRIRATRNF